MHYRVYSTMVKATDNWYATRREAIAAFERSCKRVGLAPPLDYPPGISGDNVTSNDLVYPRRTCAAGPREGHGVVCVESRNDVLGRT